LHDRLDRRENVGIAAAATNIAAHQFSDFIARLGAALGDQSHGRADLSGRAVAALKTVMRNEGGLKRMQPRCINPSMVVISGNP
jgi:hypothetical protein